MSVIAFYTNGKDQTGNTTSAISLATYMGIVQNKSILLISTALNDDDFKRAFWPEQTKKKSGLFGPNTNNSAVNDNGIEGLDLVIRSNRITSNTIKDYTRVVLKGRLELLQGYHGFEEQYKEIQKQYVQIITLAKQAYETIIIDIDNELNSVVKRELLDMADVVVAMTTQKISDINDIIKTEAEGTILKKNNTIITIGKYNNKSKYNIKNLSRSVMKSRDMVNTVPYNTLLFEDIQEGRIIELFIKFLELNTKDQNTFFIDEIKRLKEKIEEKEEEVQKMRR